MSVLLAFLLVFAPFEARAGCEDVEAAVLDSHVGWATTALRVGQQARVGEVYHLLRHDLDCLAGSGLETSNTDLFLALAAGALEHGDEEAAMAALRAALVIRSDYRFPDLLVPADHGLHAALERARAMGRDVAGFEVLFLGREQPVAPAPPAPAAVPAVSTAQLNEALEHQRFMEEVQARVELDETLHRVGAGTALIGGTISGLSLAFLAARATSGARKETVEPRPQQELMGRVWATTAIGGGVTMGVGLWMVHISQISGGGTPVLGLGVRF